MTLLLDAAQAATYEALEHLGPIWSAVCAGFAIYIYGTLYLTSSGERYLDRRDAL